MKKKNQIVSIMQNVGKDVEEVFLTDKVKAKGNIEQWLLNLVKEMQRNMRDVCKDAARN